MTPATGRTVGLSRLRDIDRTQRIVTKCLGLGNDTEDRSNQPNPGGSSRIAKGIRVPRKRMVVTDNARPFQGRPEDEVSLLPIKY